MKIDDEQKVVRAQDSLEQIHLHSAGVSLVIDTTHLGAASIVHWGAGLHDEDVPALAATASPSVMNSSLDRPRGFSLTANRRTGWSGTPSIELWRDRVPVEDFSTVLVDRSGSRAVITTRDLDGEAELRFEIELDQSGVAHLSAIVTNLSSSSPLAVGALRPSLPLPARAAEVMDFTGRWTGERRPQRHVLRHGTWSRSARRGRPGHDAPFVTIVGTPGFTNATGEVWGMHLAWSGDQHAIVERLPEGAGVHASVLGAAELLEFGEVTLGPGESYTTPTLIAAWSGKGLDGLTSRLHDSIRDRASHPSRPRPMVLNTWEAVYFDHDPQRLAELARVAAHVGVERFVLDDGWFRGRRDDTAGLGDWFVDRDKWPRGLLPLSTTVRALGMEFGLWFEPEMLNPDSDLARDHPDWLLGEADGMQWRHQYALDFSRADVRHAILERLDAVIAESHVDFVKWDHNRDLHASRSSDGRRRLRAHTLGVYEVIDELRRRHPSLEIETCASGGARVDLGMLRRTDRVWASDCNDPIERQEIQRWTTLLLPPELVGVHLGPPESHTTHRHASFSLRAATALFGHAGIEWDLSTCTPEELEQVSRWTALYRELRPLLHGGRTVNADWIDEGAAFHGVVARDGSEAVYAWTRSSTSATAHSARVPFPGLDESVSYLVTIRREIGEAREHQISGPGWLLSQKPIVLSGRLLAEGLPLPVLNPGQAMLLHLKAADAPTSMDPASSTTITSPTSH